MSLFSLNNVNFKNIITYPKLEIAPNTATFLCGKSGCGKSTLLKLLNASISPDSGDIFYQGKRITEYDTILLRREVLLVSQNVFLFEDTIKNNFAEFYRYRDSTPPKEDRILSYLRLCNIDFPLDALCSDMSGGERQRIFISICLSFLPKVLMLDEPTSALDGKTAEVMIQHIKNHCKENGITLIVISHDQALAKQYADEMITLSQEVSNGQ